MVICLTLVQNQRKAQTAKLGRQEPTFHFFVVFISLSLNDNNYCLFSFLPTCFNFKLKQSSS